MRLAVALSALLLAAHAAYAEPMAGMPRESKACTAPDVLGLRKLRRVFETSPGAAGQRFEQAPHQFIFLKDNQTMAMLTGSLNYPSAETMNAALKNAFDTDIRQYVLGETGALYFYKGGKPTAAYACQVVTADDPPNYRKNDLVLVERDAATGAPTLNVYGRHVFLPPPAAAPPPRTARPAIPTRQQQRQRRQQEMNERRAVQEEIMRLKRPGL